MSVFLIILQVRRDLILFDEFTKEGISAKEVSYRYKKVVNSGKVSTVIFLWKSCENRKVYPANNYGKIAVSGGIGLLKSKQVMTEKITIIEGPTPEFREVNGLWIQGVADSPGQFDTYFTELRAFDGYSLVDRCINAWQNKESIVLEYRTEAGLTDEITILAAHNEESDDGDLIQLWVRQPREDVEFELNFDDSDDEEEYF